MSKKSFPQALLKWYDQHGRKDLPWRQHITPYRVWLSEVMLQQTQVKTVIPYFLKFFNIFSNFKSLAKANLDQVLQLWSGLGYYSRGRNLHKTARIIDSHYNSQMPDDYNELIRLPGIGRSTAGAILAIAFQKPFPILDGNVKRILTRLFAIQSAIKNTETQKQLWYQAENLLPRKRIADYIQAQMDLGANICIRQNPKCDICPVQSFCLAYQQQLTAKIPAKQKKKPIPTKTTYMLILLNKNKQFLLQRRPPIGIWGGLWSLPEIADLQNLANLMKKQFGVSIYRYRELASFRHTFTHFHLIIHPYLITNTGASSKIFATPDQQWYNIQECQSLGLPTPVKKILLSLEKNL